MKTRKTFITLAIALALVCGMVIGANAADTLKEISAYLNYGITIKYNGEEQNLADASGNRVYPITYNGTTYLPIRAVSNMLGIGVEWDGATQTVLLGKTEAAVNLFEAYTPYTPYQSTSLAGADRYYGPIFYQNADTLEKIGGETVSSWLNLWTISERGNIGNTLLSSFNIGGKYTTLTFKAYSDKDATLTIKGDNGSVLAEFNLTGGKVPQTFTVDLLNTTQLTFERSLAPEADDFSEWEISTYIFDAKLEA